MVMEVKTRIQLFSPFPTIDLAGLCSNQPHFMCSCLLSLQGPQTEDPRFKYTTQTVRQHALMSGSHSLSVYSHANTLSTLSLT